MKLIEKLEEERQRLNRQANNDMSSGIGLKESHSYMVGLVGGLTNAIKIVEQHSEWINADDCLPNEGVKVLAWHNRKEKFFIATYDRDLKLWLNEGKPYSSEFLYNITRWMPLPKIPSEE